MPTSDTSASGSAFGALASVSNKVLSRRSVLRGGVAGAALLGLGGLLAACTPSGSATTATGGAAKLTHWDWWVSQEPWITNEIALFEKANSGVTITRTLNQFDQYANLIALAQRSSTLPDTYMLPYVPSLPDQVAGDWLTPLNGYIDDAWIKSFPKYSFVEGVNVFDGKVYTAPVTATAPGFQLYINNKVFKDAGLVDGNGDVLIPNTWDDVTKYAETISKKGNGSVYGLGLGSNGGAIFNAWVNTFVLGAGTPGGYNLPDYRTGEFTFGTDRNYADFIELLTEWTTKGFLSPDALSATDEVSRANFASGKYGMTVGGSYVISPWVEAGFTDFTVTTLISPTAKKAGYFQSTPGGFMLGVSSDTKNADAAFSWLSWWASKDAGARFTQKYNIDLSVHPENNDPSKISSTQFGEYASLVDLVRRAPSPAILNPDIRSVKTASVTPALRDIIVGVLTEQITDVGGALDALGDASNAALDAGIAEAVAGGAKVSRKDYVFADWDPTTDYEYDIPEYPTL